jgi:2-oxoglutarate dehydrogenase E2 component (dihydrolipoamide succinyltransferase)
MSTPEDKALRATPDDASPQTDDAPADAGAQHAGSGGALGSGTGAVDALSPAVRRLVRQFDLDITGIHGTGPSGRIRLSDVMGLLGGRTDSGNRDAPWRATGSADDAALTDDALSREDAGLDLPRTAATEPPARSAVPTSTIFDCDLGRALAHRKRLRAENVDLLTTSYWLTALATALDSVPEITAGHPPRFGVWLSTPEGALRFALLDTATVSWDSTLDARVRAIDGALRANLDADVASANLLVHHYGESGSVLATPTPIGDDHAASVGIGRVRREVVVRTVNGTDTPRVAACCYLSLSFFDDRVPLHHANLALGDAVRILEAWPE